MSGSSGGGGSYDSFDGGDEIDCRHFLERVNLSSPDPSVISTLSTGDVLAVVLSQRGSVSVLEAQSDSQQVAGSLIPRGMARLIQCIGQGILYEATVLDINDGLVSVEIRANP